MMGLGDLRDRVQEELRRWPGVTVHDHRLGGLEFRVNGKEMGHMHGDLMVDLQFPSNMRKKLIKERKALPHHFIPKSSWLSYSIEKSEDVEGAIELFRLQYQRMTSEK